MAFELDARENRMAFPCSICKKNTQAAEACRETCGLYDISGAAAYALKKDVEQLIDSRRQHPTKQST
jgi:hypothetical protein